MAKQVKLNEFQSRLLLEVYKVVNSGKLYHAYLGNNKTFMKSLVNRGLVEWVEGDGRFGYDLTAEGRKVGAELAAEDQRAADDRERLNREYKAAAIRHEQLWRAACSDIPVDAKIAIEREELSYIVIGDFQVMRLPDSEEFGVMPTTSRKMSIIEAEAYRDTLAIAIKVAQQVNAAMRAMANFQEGA